MASFIASLPYQDKIYFGRWNFYSGSSGTNTKCTTPSAAARATTTRNTYELQGSVTKVRGLAHAQGRYRCSPDQLRTAEHRRHSVLSAAIPHGRRTLYQQRRFQHRAMRYASFLLGGVSGSSNYPLFPWWKQMYIGARTSTTTGRSSRKLTLNLGLRYDLTPARVREVESHERAVRSERGQPRDHDSDAATASRSSSRPAFRRSQIAKPAKSEGQHHVRRRRTAIRRTPAPLPQEQLWPALRRSLIRLSDKLVLRSGFGLYYVEPEQRLSSSTAGFSTSTNINNSLDSGRTHDRRAC